MNGGTATTEPAATAPWWTSAVVYQVYPRSFQDSDGDGDGDLRGILRRVDYLAELGVDVVWLSPVYRSPQDDNGYDISDYQDIDPLFGTLQDLDLLIAAVHERGIKVMMENPKRDWYWWHPARDGMEPGAPGAEPTGLDRMPSGA